jgi:hypothetical protein
MKKLIFICLLAIITLSSRQTLKAQITLEHTYDTASVLGYNYNPNQLYMISLELEGMKYIKINRTSNIIELYNIDHSLFKVMTIPTFPNTDSTTNFQVLYVSEHLFNNDNLIEYMLFFEDNLTMTGVTAHTRIINELGNIIFSADSGGPACILNMPIKQVPIYNTSNGTKMILSFYSLTNINFGYANVYSLPGTLTNSIAPITFGNGDQMLENIYPNPSNGNTTIAFNLPQGVNQGEIVIYNMQGVELKSYKVDNTFHTLLLNNSEFRAGTYFYQLMTNNGTSGAKKMVVIH